MFQFILGCSEIFKYRNISEILREYTGTMPTISPMSVLAGYRCKAVRRYLKSIK